MYKMYGVRVKMRFDGLSTASLFATSSFALLPSVPLPSGMPRIVAAILLIFTLAGCGFGGGPRLANNPQELSHNKLATKVLADIAVQSVRGTAPARIASRRGLDAL